MISHPYLTENISSGDKFNPVALCGLILVGFMTFAWLKSSWGLIGNFTKAIGIFGKNPIEEVQASTNKKTNPPVRGELNFYNAIDQDPNDQRRISQDPDRLNNYTTQPTFTPYPTYTPYPTPTPFNQFGYRFDPVNHQIKMPDINYDLQSVLYDQQELLKNRVENGGYSPQIYNSKYSYYWPPLGGINCDKDCNVMASGYYPGDWVGIGWACDMSISFNTIIYIKELNIYGICVDRGGAIRQDSDGLFWFDHLIKSPLMAFGSKMTVFVYGQ